MSKLICCYCQKILCHDYDTDEDSHGACEECAAKVVAELEKEKLREEESFDIQKSILDTYSIITNPGGKK